MRSTAHLLGAVALAWSSLAAASALAQIDTGTPEEVRGVGVDQRVGAAIPLGLSFTDDHGEKVDLHRYFDGKKPAMLTLNYSNCPMLCSLQLDALVEGLKGVDLEPGKDFNIVTVSIDPDETWQRARTTKEKYLALLERSGGDAGWHFLTGDVTAINDLCAATGFRYRKNEQTGEYIHSAALIFVTPDGKISHYFGDLSYPSTTLELSLVDAGRGTIGSIADTVFLWCFQYDHTKGQYTLFATNFMKAGAVATVLALIALFWWLKSSTSTSHPSTPVEVTR